MRLETFQIKTLNDVKTVKDIYSQYHQSAGLKLTPAFNYFKSNGTSSLEWTCSRLNTSLCESLVSSVESADSRPTEAFLNDSPSPSALRQHAHQK